MIIAFEGIDGSGKSTQARFLCGILRNAGQDCILLTQPSRDTDTGRLIRQVLSGEKKMSEPALALLFAADRTEQYQSVIVPALEKRQIVVSDRWFYSSYVYQNREQCTGRWLADINGWLPHPNILVYLKVSPGGAEGVVDRLRSRGGPLEIYEDSAALRGLSESYDQVIDRVWLYTYVREVDAMQPLEVVSREVERAVGI